MRKTLGLVGTIIATLGIGGCDICENKRPAIYHELNNIHSKVIANYGDRNDDGVLTLKEITELKGEVAKVNGVLYRKNWAFLDKDGKDIDSEKQRIEMYKNYLKHKSPK